MEGIWKVLGIGAVGFLLYESGVLNSLLGKTATPTTGGATPPATPPPSALPPPGPQPPGPIPTWKLALDAAGGGNPLLTFDEWNTWWSSKTGKAGPDPTPYVGSDRTQKLQVADWWKFMQQWTPGLQGLRMGPWQRAPVHPLDPWGGRFN